MPEKLTSNLNRPIPLCTGRAPFTATNPLNVLLNVLDSEPTSPSSLNRELPKPLERICMRCLEKRPVNRYESATQLADDLQRFLKDEPLQSQRQDVWQGLRRWSRREPALVAHLCGILVVLVIIQIAHRVLASDLVYHYAHVYVLCVWMAVSCLLQKLMKVPRWETTARLTWVCADVLLFTAILYMAEPPRGPLLIGYPLLVTASGLFFRVRFVAFTTVISVAASFVLVVVSREEAVMAHYRFLFAGGLTVLGCIVAAQVRRVRALSQYYEGRN